MKTWTPEAEERLGHYLQEVLELARSQGDQGDDFLDDLQTHIRSDAEEKASGVVTLQNLERALASAGTPYDVLGMGSPDAARGGHHVAGPTGIGAVRPSTDPEAPAGNCGSPEAPAPQVVLMREQRRSSRILTCAGVVLIAFITLLVAVAILGVGTAILLPGLARSREAARRASCQNNLKQLGILFTGYADSHDGRFPSWSDGPVPLLFEQSFPLEIDSPFLQFPSGRNDSQSGESDYIYLGVVVRDQQELELWIDEIVAAGRKPGGDWNIPGPGGELQPLREERSDAHEVPVLVERGHFHESAGGHVLYLDGHIEFVKLGQKFPMTAEFFAAVDRILPARVSRQRT